MERIPGFRQASLLSLERRLGAALRRGLLGRFVRSKRVRLLEIRGRRYKRLTLPDSFVAHRVAAALEVFRPYAIFPGLVAEADNELLLDFVEGEAPRLPFDANRVEALASFFAVLYGVGQRRVDSAETAFPAELERDLAFLRDVGVLGDLLWRDLAQAAERRCPEAVWLGYDYLDPIPRNFVVTEAGRLVAVDVEELAPEQLLGSGVAKALLRSVGAERPHFLDALKRQLPFDLLPSLPFTELHFLAGWTKRAYLKGRAKLVDPRLFESHRSG